MHLEPSGRPVADILGDVRQGERISAGDAHTLLVEADLLELGLAAREVRDRLNDPTVATYNIDRNINYTNVCTFKCTFCGFSKGPASLNLRGKPYLLSNAEIADRVREAADLGATEVCLQGGIHPDFDGDYYVQVTRTVKAAVPSMHVHGFTALEVTEGARRLGEPLQSYLIRMKEAGLASLPGTAAEILDDRIRRHLCPDKITTAEWSYVMTEAHGIGLRSTATIMFGHIDGPRHWAEHLEVIRRIQRAMLFGSFSSRSPSIEGSVMSSRRLSSDRTTDTREIRRVSLVPPQRGHEAFSSTSAKDL